MKKLLIGLTLLGVMSSYATEGKFSFKERIVNGSKITYTTPMLTDLESGEKFLLINRATLPGNTDQVENMFQRIDLCVKLGEKYEEVKNAIVENIDTKFRQKHLAVTRSENERIPTEHIYVRWNLRTKKDQVKDHLEIKSDGKAFSGTRYTSKPLNYIDYSEYKGGYMDSRTRYIDRLNCFMK